MSNRFYDLMFTPSVEAEQARMGLAPHMSASPARQANPA
jgi:hypothetical protein